MGNMTDKEMAAIINRVAKKAKKEHELKLVEIDWSLPSVRVKKFLYEGFAAKNLLEHATTISNRFNTSLENTLIWLKYKSF